MKLKVTIDGKVYEVDVDASELRSHNPATFRRWAKQWRRRPRCHPFRPPAQGGKDAVADENKVCRSPMAGVVVRVSAQVGQQIQANDVLLVLEAMKMETVVTAVRAGKIAKVNVKAGDSVQGGQVMVELE